MARDVSREDLILHNEVRILHIPNEEFNGEDEDADILRVIDVPREDSILRNDVRILHISKVGLNEED